MPCLIHLLTWLHVSDYTIIFGTRVDGILQNSFAFNNCFSYINVFQNSRNALSKMVLKTPVFLSVSLKFCIFQTIRFVQISPARGTKTTKYQTKLCMERLYTSKISICNGNTKEFNGKSMYVKQHAKQNCMVQNVHNFELSGENVSPFLKKC